MAYILARKDTTVHCHKWYLMHIIQIELKFEIAQNIVRINRFITMIDLNF